MLSAENDKPSKKRSRGGKRDRHSKKDHHDAYEFKGKMGAEGKNFRCLDVESSVRRIFGAGVSTTIAFEAPTTIRLSGKISAGTNATCPRVLPAGDAPSPWSPLQTPPLYL